MVTRRLKPYSTPTPPSSSSTSCSVGSATGADEMSAGEPMEVITIGLTSVPNDEVHLRMALSYGAIQQAKVRLVVYDGYSPEALDTLVERQLETVSQKLRLLPPVIEVQWPQALASVEHES